MYLRGNSIGTDDGHGQRTTDDKQTLYLSGIVDRNKHEVIMAASFQWLIHRILRRQSCDHRFEPDSSLVESPSLQWAAYCKCKTLRLKHDKDKEGEEEEEEEALLSTCFIGFFHAYQTLSCSCDLFVLIDFTLVPVDR